MGVLGKVAGDGADKGGGLISSAFSGVTGIYKDALAANKADDIYEADVVANDAKVGKLHNTGVIHDIGDGVEDALNIATMGVSRRITNVFTKEIDYKALKTEKKAAKEAGENLSVKDRTAALSRVVSSSKYKGIDLDDPDVASSAEFADDEPEA